jgi:4-alpha-glucanotransferase
LGVRISLALTLHNHQPVGNFGWVLADVFDRAYEPMLFALERHPTVRLSMHYSGPLLDWLRSERPEAIQRLRELVARGQIEILGGGDSEPVLASLPERDRIGQLVRMRDSVETLFGQRPRGAWLAERVWEPDLPTSLVAAGYEWTILDDAHFRAAAIPEADLWGPYTTDDQGHLIRIFGTEEGLRYRIPFRPVPEIIEYLRAHATDAGDRVGMMGDDGEKFGAWPTTQEHCWGEGRWVDRFFTALEENADWLSTTTPSDWLDRHPPIGRVYVPTGSYAEMGEWALPADEAISFEAAVRRAAAEGRPEARWLRGAFWRNFQVRYREINDLHKMMLRASTAVDEMPEGPARDRAVDRLFAGQSNDPYWHGLFGGVYLSHIRAAAHANLIAAQDLADTASGSHEDHSLVDLDLDGVDEVRLANDAQVVTVDLGEGAGIGGWDVRAVRHSLTDVMRRRPEAYHEHVRRLALMPAPTQPGGVDRPQRRSAIDMEGPRSIHDTLRLKELGLEDHLVYDAYERRSGLVRVLSPDATMHDWAMARAIDLGDAVDGAFEVVDLAADRLVVRRAALLAGAHVDVTRTVVLGGDRAAPTLEVGLTLEHRDGAALDVRLGLEWSLTMLGGGANPAAWWEFEGRRRPHDSSGEAADVDSLAQGNDTIGITVRTSLDEPADAWWAPIETVSNSEDGFERVYQGAGLLLSWPLRLVAGERWERTVRHAVRTDRDERDSGGLSDNRAIGYRWPGQTGGER